MEFGLRIPFQKKYHKTKFAYNNAYYLIAEMKKEKQERSLIMETMEQLLESRYSMLQQCGCLFISFLQKKNVAVTLSDIENAFEKQIEQRFTEQ